MVITWGHCSGYTDANAAPDGLRVCEEENSG